MLQDSIYDTYKSIIRHYAYSIFIGGIEQELAKMSKILLLGKAGSGLDPPLKQTHPRNGIQVRMKVIAQQLQPN